MERGRASARSNACVFDLKKQWKFHIENYPDTHIWKHRIEITTNSNGNWPNNSTTKQRPCYFYVLLLLLLFKLLNSFSVYFAWKNHLLPFSVNMWINPFATWINSWTERNNTKKKEIPPTPNQKLFSTRFDIKSFCWIIFIRFVCLHEHFVLFFIFPKTKIETKSKKFTILYVCLSSRHGDQMQIN